MKLLSVAFVAGFIGLAQGTACPFSLLKRAGILTDADAAKFEAVKRDPAAAEALFQEYQRQEANEKREPQSSGLLGGLLGELPLGGGLVNGLLQPLTGVLAALDLPSPQPQGLAVIPDANHPFIAPGPTDVRGICPTLNALANHGYISRDGVS
jgi:hypothetical protein